MDFFRVCTWACNRFPRINACPCLKHHHMLLCLTSKLEMMHSCRSDVWFSFSVGRKKHMLQTPPDKKRGTFWKKKKHSCFKEQIVMLQRYFIPAYILCNSFMNSKLAAEYRSADTKWPLRRPVVLLFCAVKMSNLKGVILQPVKETVSENQKCGAIQWKPKAFYYKIILGSVFSVSKEDVKDCLRRESNRIPTSFSNVLSLFWWNLEMDLIVLRVSFF